MAEKSCVRCNNKLDLTNFPQTKSSFFIDGHSTICVFCLTKELKTYKGSLDSMDKLCAWLDWPFLPEKWAKIFFSKPENCLPLYYNGISEEQEYEKADWREINDKYLELQEKHQLDEIFEDMKSEKMISLRKKWGETYSVENLRYLENLCDSIVASQKGVANDSFLDNVYKLCKIALIIDEKLRDKMDIDKDLKGYDTLFKMCGLSQTAATNREEFDSIGELVAWLEKRGWVNEYYDRTPRDIVDLTITSIQAANRRLYTNESSIGEEIERRIESLKIADEMESRELENFASSESTLDTSDVDAYDTIEEFDPEAF